MKAKYLSILTAIAALASCTKEFFPDKPDAGQPGETLRTITLSFDAPTKSWLSEDMDGNWQPLFNEGDSILVSNGIKLDTCRVFPKKTGVVSLKQPMAILTKLEGPLTAVYPYTAALCEDNTITGTKVPSEQSGSFADANICMANQSGVEEESLVFSTKVAILRFYTKGFEVDSIRIKSGGNPIAFDEEHQITLVPKQQKVDNQAVAQQEMGKQVLTIDPGYWYAAIDVEQGSVLGKDLTFESVTHTQDTLTVKKSTSEVSLKANTMYNAFIPYYIKIQVETTASGEPEYQYWGYCNIGAFEPEESGDYFMWGEIKGHKLPPDGTASINGPFYSDFMQFDFSDRTRYIKASPINGFYSANAPYFADSAPQKYNSTDGKTTLEPMDDAATDNWGEGWRMPTKEEFEELIGEGYISEGSGWMQFGDYLFFPATGSGSSLQLLGNETTHYWSSTLGDTNTQAWTLYSGKNCVDTSERYSGYPIRPIYEKPSSEETFGVTITQYTNGGTL